MSEIICLLFLAANLLTKCLEKHLILEYSKQESLFGFFFCPV